MSHAEPNTTIIDALRAAKNAKIIAAIGVEPIDDDTAADGRSMTFAVMVDGSYAFFGDDIAAASAGFARFVAEAIAERAKPE